MTPKSHISEGCTLTAQIAFNQKLAQTFRLRPFSKALLAAECLDLLTTIAGLWMFPQIIEVNPLLVSLGGWIPLLIFKAAATLLIVYVFERYSRWSNLVWIVPTIAILPVFWNIICILAEALL